MITVTREEFQLWSELSKAVRQRINKITPIISKTNKYGVAAYIQPYEYILEGNYMCAQHTEYDYDEGCRQYSCEFPIDFLFMSDAELNGVVNKILEQEEADRKAFIEKSEREQKERDYKKYLELKKRFEKSNGGKEN